MAALEVQVGEGATLVCSSGWTCRLTDIKFNGPKYDEVITTCLSDTNVTRIRAPIYDAVGMDVSYQVNPDNLYPYASATVSTDTFTVYYPAHGTVSGLTQRSRTAIIGFVTELPHDIPVSPKLIEGTMKIAFTGALSHTNES